MSYLDSNQIMIALNPSKTYKIKLSAGGHTFGEP
jgi:hypothetical protein